MSKQAKQMDGGPDLSGLGDASIPVDVTFDTSQPDVPG